jgi:hypothetical protein
MLYFCLNTFISFCLARTSNGKTTGMSELYFSRKAHDFFFSLQHFKRQKMSSIWCEREDARTTDTQWENRLHWTAKNPIPIPNSYVRPKHILSATSALIFRFLWFMPSLGVREPNHSKTFFHLLTDEIYLMATITFCN